MWEQSQLQNINCVDMRERARRASAPETCHSSLSQSDIYEYDLFMVIASSSAIIVRKVNSILIEITVQLSSFYKYCLICASDWAHQKLQVHVHTLSVSKGIYVTVQLSEKYAVWQVL